MRLAYSTLGCPNWTAPQAAEALAAAGYDGVELRVLGGEFLDPDKLSTSDRQALKGAFRTRGLAIAAVDTSCWFTMEDPSERLAMERSMLAFLELAAELESPMVRVFGGALPEGMPKQAAALRVAGSLRKAAPRAEALGITIALETHDDFATAQTAMGVLDLVPSPAVGVVWDIHHPYRMGESVETSYHLVKERLVHVHLKDAVRRPDFTWRLVLPGRGDVPFRQAIDLLKAGGYDGWVSAEWDKYWHPSIEEPGVAVPEHAAVLRPLLGGGQTDSNSDT